MDKDWAQALLQGVREGEGYVEPEEEVLFPPAGQGSSLSCDSSVCGQARLHCLPW